MQSTTVDPDTELAQLVETNTAFADVFESVGLDYCCGGKRSLEAACDEADLEVEAVLERLQTVRSDQDGARPPGVTDDRSWNSLTQLVNLIVWEHHRYLRNELPEIEELAQKVARVHGESHPNLRELEDEVEGLVEEMTHHIADEEQNAFPVIKKVDDGESLSPADEVELRDAIDHLEDEHDETAARLERLAALTDDYTVPEDACASYRRLFDGLETLERNTHMHVHRENNVLFPEAAAKLDS
ncbi:iron-sulfur cluster repair di-iron protein [Natrialbaceae archaeon A-arb3/5]